MALLTKLLIAVLATVAGSWSPASGPLEFRRILVGTLDLIFTFAFFAFIALQIDLFRVSPIEERGLDAIGPLLGALALAALKGFLFVLMPAILLTRFLRRFESLLPRIFIYGVFTALGLTGHHFAQQRATAEAAIAASKARRDAENLQQSALQDTKGMEFARRNAEKREIEAHTRYLTEFLQKSEQANTRWRADIEAAGAIGAEGEAPPLIRVHRVNDTEIKVTNISGKRICMSVSRVLRKRGTDEYERCEVDRWEKCYEVPHGYSQSFGLYRKQESRACTDGHLEYRIGNSLRPDPSWWSRSAIEEFDRNPPDLRKTHGTQTTLQLRGLIAQLDKQLVEAAPGRDSRDNRD